MHTDQLYIAVLQTALQHELKNANIVHNQVGQPIVDEAVVRRSFDLADAMLIEHQRRSAKAAEEATPPVPVISGLR